MALPQFWPAIEEINECIKNEAETAHEAILLAVHQPIPIQKKTVAGGNVTQSSEYELLDFFLTPDPPSGTVVMPITGPSGVGKSHIIRWIESQIKFRDPENRFHIIRIPKSASLRNVVKLILEPLHGEQYENLRNELQKAAAEITHETSVIQLLAGLRIALNNYADQLRNNQDNMARIGHAKRLADFFQDAALSNHFSQHVFSKLTKRALEGRNLNENDADTLPQFEPDDLKLPDDLDINNAAEPVKKYYLKQLATTEQKKQAVDILNSVLDEAIRFAFKLSGQLGGGKTLQDLVLEIRKQLLNEEKELMLLIEDFVALAGIQSAILEIAIKEAIHDGNRHYCNMRTAIAVTDGLAGRDTILTRAQYEWIIQSQIENPEELVVDLVSSYLNAARYGSEKIKSMRREQDDNASLTGWLKSFNIEEIDADTLDMLKAFGKSPQGHWLFPFNRQMIRQMMEQYLKQGDNLTFNPRTVINRIIRDILLLRNDFMQKKFPPSSIKHVRGTAFVAQTISARVPQEQRDRYECFLSLWGGNPNDQNGLNSVSPLLFNAFGLNNLSEGQVEPPPPPKPVDPDNQPPDPNLRWIELFEKSKQWEGMLENWVAGTQMPQAEANMIRQHLRIAVSNYINWNQLCIAEQPINAAYFWIPKASGNQNETIKIAEDNKDEDGRLRFALTALYRYDKAGYTWNYPGGSKDSLYYVEFIEDITNKAVDFIVQKTSSELVPIMQGLYVGSHVIGASTEDSKKIDSVLKSITIKQPDEIRCTGLHAGWDDVINSVSTSWNKMQKAFFERCACYQGDGNKEFAVNYPLLSTIFENITFYGEINSDGLTQDIKPVLQQINNNNIFQSKVRNIFEQVNDWRNNVTTRLGEDFDKKAVIESFRNLIKNTTNVGCWPDRVKTSDEIKGLIKEFELSPVKDILDKIKQLPSEFDLNQIHSYIPIFGQIDGKVLSTTANFIIDIDRFLTVLEPKSDFMIEQLKENDADAAAKSVLNQFEELTKNLQEISGARQ